jgi:hypothetical protein
MYPMALSRMGYALEIDVVSCIKFMLCHGRLLWLAHTYVSHMFFASGFDGLASLFNIDFAAFAGDTVYTCDF